MSTLKVNNISNTGGTKSATTDDIADGRCRAWVNFNGIGTNGTNMTIVASFNVSSVYKNGTGDYTISFTNAMSDANYLVVGGGVMDLATNSANSQIVVNPYRNETFMTASSFRTSVTLNGGAGDYPKVYVMFFR